MAGVLQEMKETLHQEEILVDDHHLTAPRIPRRRRTGGSPDGDPGDDGSLNNGRYPSR